jgi:hypothetical protein
MLLKYKAVFISIGVALITFVLNFITFLVTYNKLATPYINEEQRVENASFILTATIGSFAVIAILVGVAFYFFTKKR